VTFLHARRALTIEHLPDPRVEKEERYETLPDSLVNIAVTYRDRIDTDLFLPRVDRRRPHNDRRREPVGTGGRAVTRRPLKGEG
jgi:hypothetical protein